MTEQEPQGDAAAEQGAVAPGGGAERQRMEGEFLLALRRNGSIMQLLGQVSAERIGINATDLNCLNIVAVTRPMTAGEAARAARATTAAVTAGLGPVAGGGVLPPGA